MPTALLLREALPYLKRFHGKVFVLKAGGKVLTHPDFPLLIQDIATLTYMGIRVIGVFGAGPQLNEAFRKRKLASRTIHGMRVTLPAMMPVMEEVLEWEAQMLTTLFAQQGVRVHRIEECLEAQRHTFEGIATDEHRTGSVCAVDERCIASLFAEHCLPLCLPIIGNLNCNADDVALAIARSLQVEKLIFLTGTKGILVPDPDGAEQLLTSATPQLLQQHIDAGHIDGGMIPKARAAMAAVDAGIPRVHIISGLHDGTLLRELFSKHGSGTLIAKAITPDEA
ncbi:hypothetical protein HY213_04770 [Candidatus Peregrinibacteria bacterium]|nr:hypothetical protein [Candidatus Peregrinibacteria bacterium]